MNKLFFLALILVFNLFSTLAQARHNSGLAVVLIDMQYAFYERSGVSNTPELKSLIKNQQKLLLWAKKENIPVLVFQMGYVGPTDKRIMDTLKGHNFVLITKTTDSGFKNDGGREARKFLDSFNVDTLIVAGINGPHCVRSTIKDAIETENYDVITSDDIVADANFNPIVYPFSNFRIDSHKFLQYKTVKDIIYNN